MLEDPTYSNYRMTNELLEALTSTNDPRTLYIGGAYYTDSKRTDITSIVYERPVRIKECRHKISSTMPGHQKPYHQYRWKRCKCSTPLPEDPPAQSFRLRPSQGRIPRRLGTGVGIQAVIGRCRHSPTLGTATSKISLRVVPLPPNSVPVTVIGIIQLSTEQG